MNTTIAPSVADRYLELLSGCLTRLQFDEEFVPMPLQPRQGLRRRLGGWHLQRTLDRTGYELVRRRAVDRDRRAAGRDHPPTAETMVGLARLANVRSCIETCLHEDVPGDLLEAGVWRGGTAIYMRAVLAAHGVSDRSVWAADSFAGLPPPDPGRYPSDENDRHHANTTLAVSLEQVQANFERYNLLDAQVRFLRGWFEDTLPSAPIERLAVLRLDGDMYASTIQALEALYPKVSPGGFVIIDDYGELPGARRATDDFRSTHSIEDPLIQVDHTAVYWRRAVGS